MTKIIDKRAAIIEATLKLVSKKGFHGTAMSMVSKEAGVSAGIIYHYFKNKDELMYEIYKELKKRIADAVNSKHDSSLPLREQIRRNWSDMIRYCIANPIESGFIDQFSKSPYYDEGVEKEVLVHFKLGLDLVAKGEKEMIIKDFPLMVYSAFSVDIANSLAQKHALGMLELTDDLIEEVIDATWDAIKL